MSGWCGAGGQTVAPWHFLNFLPLPQGHGALRGVFDHSSFTTVCCFTGAWAASATAASAAGVASPAAIAARAADVKPLVIFPSSASVYGNPTLLPVTEGASLRPISPYGFHKVICEQLAQEYAQCFGLNVVVARLFSTIGPAQQRLLVWELFRQAIDDNPYLTIQGTGTETRDFLHIDDICRYFLGIAERQPKGFWAVNVASGSSTSVRTMAEIVTRLVGSRKAIVTLNKELPGDPKHWQADTSLLLDLVSYQPGDITRGVEHCVGRWSADVALCAEKAMRGGVGEPMVKGLV